jgi:hypothetical protein
METAQEFMERYLREKVEMQQFARKRSLSVYQKFFTEEYVNRVNDFQTFRAQNLETLVIAEVSDTSAKIITSGLDAKKQQRFRYHLELAGEAWKINGQERECFFCGGTGQQDRGTCSHCEGKGWRELFSRD